MPESKLRDTATRKKDVLAALEAQGHYWLVTAELGGRPHVIGVSGWWDDGQIVVATVGSSRTARNMAMNPLVKLAHGDPADAIVIEAQMIDSRAVEDSSDLAAGFAAAVGWDPREVGGGWMFFRLRPTRIQAFRGYDEIQDRDVMVRSRWVI
jgi:hypothetical protein